MTKLVIAQVAWNTQTSIYQVQEKTARGATIPHMDFESAIWQEWLAQRSSFAFQSKNGHRFTARKEARARGSSYWVAYRKLAGKLTHTYLGRPADITLSRLEEVAAALAEGETAKPLTSSTAVQIQDSDQILVQGPFAPQLLATKFFVPVASHALIARPRLMELRDEIMHRPLTLVSAPAGFGKTSLLSAWVQSLPPGSPFVCWISLDEDDNDPVRFWISVLTALDRVRPGMVTDLLTYVHTRQLPPLQSILSALINRLTEQSAQFLLVLDDYHLLTEQAIHTSFAYLVDHLPRSCACSRRRAWTRHSHSHGCAHAARCSKCAPSSYAVH